MLIVNDLRFVALFYCDLAHEAVQTLQKISNRQTLRQKSAGKGWFLLSVCLMFDITLSEWLDPDQPLTKYLSFYSSRFPPRLCLHICAWPGRRGRSTLVRSGSGGKSIAQYFLTLTDMWRFTLMVQFMHWITSGGWLNKAIIKKSTRSVCFNFSLLRRF